MCIEAYAAGLLDGEGCIDVSKQMRKLKTDARGERWRTQYTLQVRIQMSDYEPLYILSERFGGGIGIAVPDTSHHKTIYTWAIVGPRVKDFLLAVQPYVRGKTEQLELALMYPLGTRARYSVTPELLFQREEIKASLSQMKREVAV